MIRTISRVAVGGSLTLAKLPVDGALRLTGSDSAQIALDRADATVRSVAGFVLGDDVLMEDAARRREAADERARALNLHSAAADTVERAAETVEEGAERAAQTRVAAADEAARRQREARERSEARKKQAAARARKRKAAAAGDAARQEDAIDAEARRARLDTLGTRAEALEEKEEALAAREEARLLREAASKTKAQRKARRG